MAACTFYNLCFFTYFWLMPVFLQFLIRAPSNFDPAPFYPVPMRTLSGDAPELKMSSFPQTTRSGVNHCRPCQEMGGQRSGMYQWDIMLSISEADLVKESKDKPVSTMYPLVFASNDAKVWKIVADADDVAGKGHWAGKNNDADEATHLSAPLLVANLKNFGCIDAETADTDPFFHHFSSKEKALQYKWRLVKHVAMHGSVNLVSCVMQGTDEMNQLIHTYARDCLYQGEMKCHLTPQQALSKCFAVGSACGQACNFFSPNNPECKDGTLDPTIFEGLTHRRVKIKTSPGGGGAAEALVYCSKEPCRSGLHFNNMYVEAVNPIEFLKAQMDVKNKEKGSYYVLVFAMSDFHPPTHTYEVIHDDDEDEDEDDKKEHHHHHKEKEKEDDDKKKKDEKEDDKKDDKEDKKDEKDKKDHDKAKDKPKEKPKKPTEKPKKKHEKRTCVDLPGVRLGEIEHSGLKSWVGGKKTGDPLSCTAACGQRAACQQSVFSQANKGCYLFKIPTVQVHNYSTSFNSSYCGGSSEKDIMMTMLHQAYKNYVPPAPPAPMGMRRLEEEEEAMPFRGLHGEEAVPFRGLQQGMLPPGAGLPQEATGKKYYWQIAHVPNGTRGILRDQGANEVRVIPRNTSCFTTPGFVYMVACMTAKPVYASDRTHPLRPPPFNDRCLAVGGICGATCGSGQQVTETVAKYCPLGMDAVTGRRLVEGEHNPYASAPIPRDLLVQRIDPQRNSNPHSFSTKVFFIMFVFILLVSYVTTILSKFPGNFRDAFPIHTWDEIRTHGYLLEKFGSAVTCSTSQNENKTVILRSWVGKITTRPQFDDTAFPTFAKWVDVFCDEGHREGARVLWMAWTNFLETSPPMEFLQEWATALRDLTPEQSANCSPFDLKWPHTKGKKVLPVVPGQNQGFGDDVPQGGISLQPDSLAKLRDMAEIFKVLPLDLLAETSLPRSDDVVLTRKVSMDLQSNSKSSGCYPIAYSGSWQTEVSKKTQQRMQELSISSREQYERSVTVTDKNGQRVNAFGSAASKLKDSQFPLHFREPPARKDRQVIMVYCARAKPEIDRKGIDKTRCLDRFLWASLQPKAVRKPNQGSDAGRRIINKRKQPEEEKPLLTDGSERSWSSVGQDGNPFVFEEVKKCVEGAVERQHRTFLDLDEADERAAAERPRTGQSLKEDVTKAYLQHRTVDSDWEMARFCYGEVVGVEKDADGDEVVILDNPSSALLQLASDMPTQGKSSCPPMGLVATDEEGTTDCFGNKKGRTVRGTKPSLQFKFVSTRADTSETNNFQREFRKKLAQAVSDPTLDTNALKLLEKRKGNELLVDVSGPGKVIESIRSCNLRNLEVVNFRGRMMDLHPSVVVKKDLLMPYCGVRGRSGGLNFVVDLLQFREGFIGAAIEGDATPERMLLGVFDCTHQPHPDFWKRCLPKFMNNTTSAYTYKVNDDIALVQAPEVLGKGEAESLTGVSFSILNMIRNRCGGVTSCGTNAVWQISARDFSRQADEAVKEEFFHSRTLVHDTATSHARFCKGKRSVYVQEKVSTGLNKSNSDILESMQMRAEGSVQLFWVELFSDKNRQLVFCALVILLFAGMILWQLFGPSLKAFLGYNIFCDSEGPSLLLGMDHPVCRSLCDAFGLVLSRSGDKVRYAMAEYDYMHLIDVALCWLCACLCMALAVIILACRGVMPTVVRVFIMMENISYWLTSCNIFYWLILTVFMVIGMDPPLMFNAYHFMFFALLLNITQHCMLNEYKSQDCTEISIWRSQQSHTLAAPLYISAIVQGTIAAWRIVWTRHDKSFWNSSTTAEVVRDVTVWVTFIWVAFFACIVAIVAVNIAQLVLGQSADIMQKDEHFSAFFLSGLIAVTVWEPFLSLWGMDKTIEDMSKNEKSGKMRTRVTANLMLWWRSKAWILRYIIDFCIPLLVLCGVLSGGHTVIILVAYATTVHGLRM